MTRARALLPALLASLVGTATGQVVPVHAPGGSLTGVVQDSASGTPIGYALVILVDPARRVFASESGRFSFSGLGSGRVSLRVQQIGYHAATYTLELDARPAPAGGAPGLVVRLTRQVLVLPEIVVEGDVCVGGRQLSGSAEDGALGEIFKNAERLLTLQEDYPFLETYQETTTRFDSVGTLLGGRIDTGRYDSRRILRYARGRVTVREGPLRIESALYFQPSDLARNEFRKTHCFWYSGTDSLESVSAYRFGFAPLKNVRSIDWAGSLLIDSVSMVLIRSEAHLVNLPRRGTSFLSASCTLLYHQVFPTLVTPAQARCVSRLQTKPPFTTVARWRLIDFKFLHRTPS